MQWIKDYQLILFDFDGLLVNTEEIHHRAYQNACAHWGWSFTWDFPKYCSFAHYESDALKQALFELFPELHNVGWDVFYAYKTEQVKALVTGGDVELMPGVEALLTHLERAGVLRCVVTHSPDRLVAAIRAKHTILNSIPIWFTREFYTHPKPNPECYERAIAQLASPTDHVIGFEDSPRGVRALMGTRAKPVLISKIMYPEIEEFESQGVVHYSSFEEIGH